MSADPGGIRETLANLAVIRPEKRAAWYRADYFDPRGAGVAIATAYKAVERAAQTARSR